MSASISMARIISNHSCRIYLLLKYCFYNSAWVPIERMLKFQEDHPTRPRKKAFHFKAYNKGMQKALGDIAECASGPSYTDRLYEKSNNKFSYNNLYSQDAKAARLQQECSVYDLPGIGWRWHPNHLRCVRRRVPHGMLEPSSGQGPKSNCLLMRFLISNCRFQKENGFALFAKENDVAKGNAVSELWGYGAFYCNIIDRAIIGKCVRCCDLQ